jgi:hypothetical protein
MCCAWLFMLMQDNLPSCLGSNYMSSIRAQLTSLQQQQQQQQCSKEQ